MRHFLVSTRFWRGLTPIEVQRGHNRTIRRACDWFPVWAGANYGPRCPDCVAYAENLRRLGKVPIQ